MMAVIWMEVVVVGKRVAARVASKRHGQRGIGAIVAVGMVVARLRGAQEFGRRPLVVQPVGWRGFGPRRVRAVVGRGMLVVRGVGQE